MLNARQTLLYLSIKYSGDWNKIFYRLKLGEYEDTDEEIEEIVNSYRGNYITILDSNYPQKLKDFCYHPPFVLFYEGDINLLTDSTRKIAVLASKSKVKQDLQSLDKILKDQDNLVAVIASAGTLCSHIKINYHYTRSIVVLPNGLDQEENPLQLASLVITELPNGTVKTTETCMSRTRIIAGISDKGLLLSCKNRSGTLITVNQLLMQAKEIYVLPVDYKFNNELCNNELIYQGATPVCNETVEEINE